MMKAYRVVALHTLVHLFEIKGSTLNEIKPTEFALEKDLQKLTEENLQKVFGLTYVRSEFELHGFRIDTLAFDKENIAFKIIEYKRERNFSVVDQGVAYLNLMLNNKAEFILEYNQKFELSLKREEVNWSQSRVIFIAPEFTKHQQYAVGFKEFGIELWEVHRYGNNLIAFDEVNPPENTVSIASIAKGNRAAQRIAGEIKVYTENDFLNRVGDKSREIYDSLKSGIIDLGSDVEVKVTSQYIGFWRNQLFATIKFREGNKVRIKLNVDEDKLKDPLDFAKPRKNGGAVIYITNVKDVPYVLSLVRQAYEKS